MPSRVGGGVLGGAAALSLIMDMARPAILSAAQLLDLGTCITVNGVDARCHPLLLASEPSLDTLGFYSGLPHEVRYGVSRISRYNVWGAWVMP